MLRTARPQEEERKAKEKVGRKARKARAKEVSTGKAKEYRRWINGISGVGVKEEESTIIVVNHNHHSRQNHRNHGCNFNNHPGSAAWAIGVDQYGDNRHGEDISKRGRGGIR